MLRTVLIVFLLGISLASQAQLSVVAYEKETNTTLPGAHIQLLNPEGGILQTYISDVDGKISIQNQWVTKLDTVTLVCSYIGYVTDTMHVTQKTGVVKFKLSPSNITLGEMVVTGQYSPNSTEKSVHRIKVIDKAKIQAMNAVSLRDVLTNEMNVRISQDLVLGSGMQLQGISGQNVKIMIDGVPVIGRLDGNIDLSQINLNDVERIEIVEGPLSVNYGTDALAGTINIIMKKKVENQLEANANVYAEQVGTFNVDASVAASIKKKNQFRLSIGRYYFDGWNPGDSKWFNYFEKGTADDSRVQQWNPKEQYFGRLTWNRNYKKWNFNTQTAYFNETVINKGTPRSPLNVSAFDDVYNTQRFDQAITANRTGKRSNLNIVVGGNLYKRQKNTYVKDLTTLDEELSGDASDHDTSTFYQVMSRGNYAYAIIQDKLTWEVGYDLSYEYAQGKRIEDDNKSLGDYAVFTTAEWNPIKDFTVKPGVRFTHNTAYDAPVTPSINLLYRTGKFSFRGSYAQGFRAPDLKELYYMFVDVNHNIQGNQDLKAEYSDNYSLSANYQIVKKQTIYRLEVSTFLNQIQDQINLAQTDGTLYQNINIGDYQTHGIQLKAGVLFQHLRLQAGFNYVGRENSLADDYDNVDEFSYSPEVQTSVLYNWRKKGLEFAAFYKYTGELPGYALSNDELVQTKMDPYHTLDGTISKWFISRQIRISAGVKNIFDVQQINSTSTSGGAHSSSSSSVPVGMGRVYFMKLQWQWKK